MMMMIFMGCPLQDGAQGDERVDRASERRGVEPLLSPRGQERSTRRYHAGTRPLYIYIHIHMYMYNIYMYIYI